MARPRRSQLLAWLLVGIAVGMVLGGLHAPTILRVALYPWLPDALGDDFQALVRRVETEFEAAHPHVDLRLRCNDSDDPFNNQFYETAGLQALLRDFDVVEVDGVVLGHLAQRNLIAPWQLVVGEEAATAEHSMQDGWHPAARLGAMVNGVSFGVPHWLCSFFLVTHDPEVATAAAESLDALVALMAAKGVVLTGDLASSWNLVAMFLDSLTDDHYHHPSTCRAAAAQAENNNTASPSEQACVSDIVTKLLEKETFNKQGLPKDSLALSALARLHERCHHPEQSRNLCSALNLGELPANTFASRAASAAFGYSEQLHAILSARAHNNNNNNNTTTNNINSDSRSLLQQDDALHFVKLPLQTNAVPHVFVDSLVRRQGCTGRCAQAATLFAEYLTRIETYEWMINSADDHVVGRILRYLLAARLGVQHRVSSVKEDRFYQHMNDVLKNAMPYSNHAVLPQRKEEWKSSLKCAITKKCATKPQ